MTLLVKVGGRVQSDAALTSALAVAYRRHGGRMVLVHGGGDEVTQWQRRLGIEPRFVGGRRVTTGDELETVRMVLSGSTNKRLVRQLSRAGIRAVGVSGEDGDLLIARRIPSLGAVGSPARVDVRLLEALLDAGFLPVVSPLARDLDSDEGLNVNGDDAAAAIAAALRSAELVFVSDVAAVWDSDGSPLTSLGLDTLERLLVDSTALGGMAAKLQAARTALLGGVPAVRVGDLRALTEERAGTSITLAPTTV